MELMPWRPFGRLAPLRREMDDLWDRISSDFPALRRREGVWAPSVDVSEDKENFIVQAELPGVDQKDVNVTVSGNMLTIRGEKKKEEEKKDEHHYSMERFYGSFQRSFQLPANVQTDKIEASFDKGVLKVTLPKTEEAKKKEIEIKVK